MMRGLSTVFLTLQTAARVALARIERWLDAERDQLVLWLPVALGVGIALWFALPGPRAWLAVIAIASALGIGSLALGRDRRLARVLATAGLAVALGCGLIWWRSATVAAPVLTRIALVTFEARVERVDLQTEKDRYRVVMAPIARPDLPPRVRVSIDYARIARRPVANERIALRARLVPPPPAMLPGSYDFARTAWFTGIGATGSALGPVALVDGSASGAPSLRERLSAHVRAQITGSAGGIAAAFASGDRGGISGDDEEAMRASGLTHLLSISGLHITAVVGATLFVVLRLLSLSPWLALRLRLPVIAAAAGALAGIGYTLLTGAEVPTVRSCIAAVLVMMAIGLGRRALTLRLVAAGAVLILLLWPESLIGASFQLSFTAIAAIVALNEEPRIQALTLRRDEGWVAASLRLMGALLLTGIAVEAALAPIALFHFHQTGLYGALANIVAIPLTTFIIMPVEAAALLFDLVGLGAPLWWLTGQLLALLLWLARSVAALPGAVALVGAFPGTAFALFIGGALWLMLWKTPVRLAGLAAIAAAAALIALTPAPDMLITGDGKHFVLRTDRGDHAILRPRAGDFVRDSLSETLGTAAPFSALDSVRGARCTPDMCTISVRRGDRWWRIAATRSGYRLPWAALIATCAAADIVISDRRLPTRCQPRWLKADAILLRRTGGLAINLTQGRVRTTNDPGDQHPWITNARHTVRPRAQ